MTWLYRLAVAAGISTYALIVLGGVTRISGSGMGCADDWPRCHGKWYPPLNLQSIIEYLHRTVAAYIGVLVLAMVIVALVATGVSRRTKLAAVVSLVLVTIQALLGAVTVWRELPSDIVTAHLGTAMLFFATVILTAYFAAIDRGAPAWIVNARRRAGGSDRRFAAVAQVGALVIFVLILSGGMTSTSGAALACRDWPLCHDNTQLVPDPANSYIWIHVSHRMIAVIGTLTVALIAWEARRPTVSREARRLAVGAVACIGLQIAVGAGYVLSAGEGWLATAHNAVATLLWALVVILVIVARRAGAVDSPVGAGLPRQAVPAGRQSAAATSPSRMSDLTDRSALRPRPDVGIAVATMAAPYPQLPVAWHGLRRARETARDYIALTKPGILTLLLIVTLGAMLVAAEGMPPFGLVLVTMLGGLLAAGGANVINCYVDRDIDAVMPRTQRRATATGRITPGQALAFGIALTVSATLLLGFLVNWLAAVLALIGNLYYVFVYTIWLKRRSPQNIVIGGAAGAVPPLVGWAAVTGELSVGAWLLFAVIFYWTPPHFWALALLKRQEYGQVKIPMLPVVAGERETRRQMLLYTLLLAAVGLLLVPLTMSWLYLLAALVLNGIFLALVIRLFRAPSRHLARQTFFYSLWYLALLYGAMVADRLVLA